MARSQLSKHRADPFTGESAFTGAAKERTHQAASGGALGHWGTSPGLNLVYVHLNRLINQYDLSVVYMAGPGHGGPALVANVYLEGTYTEHFPHITQDQEGMLKLFRQFSTPGRIPSHVSAPTPGSIHEGGELGYVLVHAFGAAFDNPDLIVAAVVGDGEAETGPLEGSWKGNKFLNPVRDGAVLPILHLNGYKISGPTIWGRESDDRIGNFLAGHGYEPVFVEGSDPMTVHQEFSGTLETAILKIREIQSNARENGFKQRPVWPAIVLRTPKGWTGPKIVDGLPVQGTFRAHQVPLAGVRDNPAHLKQLEEWMRSYRPEELFDEKGRFRVEYAALAPKGQRRMGANPHANGGLVSVPLDLPDFTDYALEVAKPATVRHESTRALRELLRDIFKKNAKQANFRLFCPDETNSNRLGAVFEVTNRCLVSQLTDIDPDIVLACAGDIATLETVAAAWLLRKYLPQLKVRVVNVVDLMSLCPPDRHPHGMSSDSFISLFTANKPVIFAFHGYPGYPPAYPRSPRSLAISCAWLHRRRYYHHAF